jgi:hypothetical protein
MVINMEQAAKKYKAYQDLLAHTIMHLRTEMFWGAVIAIALSVVITVIIGLITGVIE